MRNIRRFVLVERWAWSPSPIPLCVFRRLSILIPSHHSVRYHATLYREYSSRLWIWQFVISIVYLTYALALRCVLDFIFDWDHGCSSASFIINCTRFALKQFWNANESIVCPLRLLRYSSREQRRWIATGLLTLLPTRDEPVRLRRILAVASIESWSLLLLYFQFGFIIWSDVSIQVYVQYFSVDLIIFYALGLIFVIGGAEWNLVFRCDKFCFDLSLVRWAGGFSSWLLLWLIAEIHVWIWNMVSKKVHIFIV